MLLNMVWVSMVLLWKSIPFVQLVQSEEMVEVVPDEDAPAALPYSFTV